MKIHLPCDMEGTSGIWRPDQVDRGSPHFQRGQKLLVADVNAAIAGAFDGGATELVVCDTHGGGHNFAIDKMDERTTRVYDALGRATTMTHANGATAAQDYDEAARLTAVRNRKSDGTAISIFTYSYDDAGNRTAVAEASGDRVTWSYDNTYQLTREQRSGGNSYDVTYTYDAVGNRLTKLEGGTTTTYSYDAANQLSYEYTPSARTTYAYDANGNTTVVNAAGSLTTNTWDIENRMTLVQLPSGARTTATYDGDGKRRSYADSGYRNFIWDGENIFRQTGSNDVTNRRYTYNPQGYGELISEDDCFHHGVHPERSRRDALGSTMQITDASQVVQGSYLYRAFGEQTVLSGSSAIRFTWVGRSGYYRQPDTANYWLRARVQQPTIGRFLSLDPLRREANRYLYVSNRPLMMVDPSGRQGQCAAGGQLGGGQGGGGGQPGPRRCLAESGCTHQKRKDGWYVMCRRKEEDRRQWRCLCQHPKDWPSPPGSGGYAFPSWPEDCTGCQAAGDPCTCHLRLVHKPRRHHHGPPQVEDRIVTGKCLPCGGGGGGGGDGPPPRPPEPKCGPDVTQALAQTVGNMYNAYANASFWQRLELCSAFIPPLTGAAVDIVRLQQGDVSSPNCPKGEMCGGTAQVEGQCHYQWVINYIGMGIGLSLCDWVLPYIVELVSASVYPYCMAVHRDSKQCSCAVDWFLAGLNGWPAAATPTACKRECASCRETAEEAAFGVHWDAACIYPDGSIEPAPWTPVSCD